MEEEYMGLANRTVERLKDDPNILAILVYGSIATKTVSEESDIDLLLLVNEIPKDVDIFGIKRTSIDNVPVDLAHKTVEQVERQIDFEAGSWYSSSIMLNSEILHDPKGIANGLREKILQMPGGKRDFIFDCLMEDARTYPGKIRQCIKMGDLRGAVYLMRLVCDSLIQALFIANRTRPSSEKGMIRDFIALKDLPGGFVKSYDQIEGFVSIDKESVSGMLKSLEDLIEGTEEFWASKKSRA